MKVPSTLEQYNDILLSDKLGWISDVSLPSDGEFSKLCIRLLNSKSSHPFIRRGIIKRIFSRLVRIGALKGVKLRFPYSFGERAYMRDCGIVSFAMPYIASASGAGVFRVLMHEIAHLLLLSSDGYTDLISLDGKFLARYGRSSEDVAIVSPVELYATTLSLLIMDAVSTNAGETVAELIAAEKKQEEEKLDRSAKIFFQSVKNN